MTESGTQTLMGWLFGEISLPSSQSAGFWIKSYCLPRHLLSVASKGGLDSVTFLDFSVSQHNNLWLMILFRNEENKELSYTRGGHVKWRHGFEKLLALSIKTTFRERERWRRNRTARPLSPSQIPQKNISTPSKLHKTTSVGWQRTSGNQKSRSLSSKTDF